MSVIGFPTKAPLATFVERDLEILRLYNEGKSASQTAHALHLTKGQVCGAVHRLRNKGHYVRPRELNQQMAQKVSAEKRRQRQRRYAQKRAEELAEKRASRPQQTKEKTWTVYRVYETAATISEVRDGLCRFPIPNAMAIDGGLHVFCGCKTSGGKVYCEPCSAVAFLPPGHKPSGSKYFRFTRRAR